ncbi:vitronectin [Elgaria multicarinata webbii]|uniref:vitronectin n=1 Tax=Elgaria multicarinata webbii TaxID=159646 RepID=UPI002FCD18CE
MQLLSLALLLGGLCGAFAAEESCEGRCDLGFDAQKKCQCDDLCSYYQSCCGDYSTTCKSKVTRGDAFLLPDDAYLDYYDFPGTMASVPTSGEPTAPEPIATVPATFATYEHEWTEESHLMVPSGPTAADIPTHRPEEESLCSGKPFDAFTSVKNGSIYAFRGKYFYELDEKSVKPGYPRLIQEVWGIDGPIDAAFTRINCEGKMYIFQGSRYWRFDDGVLEQGFPHNISDGFTGIPDDLDAAFALPAQNYMSSERVYFFKEKRYWSYDFANQPSREDCEQTSPSAVFDHFVLLQDDEWDQFFQMLFGGSRRSGASRPRYISRDWHGVPTHLDAVMLGRMYVGQRQPKQQARRKPSRRHRRKYRHHQRWGSRKSRWEWPIKDSSESSDLDWLLGGITTCQPFQTVYFFAQDKYYRLNLQTRRVDLVYPRYPRPIAKYWLGCPSDEDLA